MSWPTIWRIASAAYFAGAVVVDDSLVRVLCGLGMIICTAAAQIIDRLDKIANETGGGVL